MPADSNLLKTWFGNLQLFWIEAVGFCKNWGVATGVDVMLYPMGWCRLHTPGAKNRGKFLKQGFDISGHRIRLVFPRTEAGRLHLRIPDFTCGYGRRL